MQWSKNQQYAIEARNRRILVSAAAGSGKTAVLVGRIIERILDKAHPIEVNNLLIMTFTRAAARQMKERISSALEDALTKVEYQSTEYKRLKRQISLIDCTNISTIDSFCKEIIVENVDKANLDPGFVIADEDNLSLLKEDILEKLLEEEYEAAKPKFLDLVMAFAGAKSDVKIANYIKLLHRQAQISAWPKKWYDKQIEDATKSLQGDVSPDAMEDMKEGDMVQGMPWLSHITRWMHTLLKDIAREMNRAISLCNLADGPAAYLERILEERSMVLSMLEASEYEKLCHLLSMMEFGRLARVAKGVDASLKEQVKGIRDQYKKWMKHLQENYVFSLDRIQMHEKNAAKYILELLRLTMEFDRRFQMEKQKNNQVDFNDLEHMALQVLYEHPMIAQLYRNKFDEIYVDEYQDSNYVQEELIRAIEKGNVFMVGDVKQSIYGFRQAKPELFTSKYNAFSDYEGNEEGNADVRIDLSTNYRSRSTVLDSINALFYRIMDQSLGNIVYDDAAALHAGAKYDADAVNFASEILLLDLEEDEEIPEEMEEDNTIELEARMIARRIKELKTTLMVRGENGESRSLCYSDIVILLRSQANRAENIARILVNQGIPAFAQTGTGYFDTFEIRKILAVLTIIDNPYKDIAFCAYLHSPMVKISDEELTILSLMQRKHTQDGGIRRLYLAAKAYLDEGTNAELKAKLQRAMDMLQEFRSLSKAEPLTMLLREIYEISGFYDFCAASKAGVVRCANLYMLLEKAAQFMKSGYQGVFSFVRYIENLKRYSTDYGEASTVGEFDDTVRIMTIHKSKGLEFPVCILANAGKRFNEMDSREDFLVDDELGIACKFVDTNLRIKSDTLKRSALAQKKKTDNIAEELRVLYVAMTRAKEKLIITATIKGYEKQIEKYRHVDAMKKKPLLYMQICEASSYLDWFLMCYEGITSDFVLQRFSQKDLIGNALAEQIEKHADLMYLQHLMPAAIDENIQARLDFSYPHAFDIRQNAKISISELKRMGQFVDESQSLLLYGENVDTKQEYLDADKGHSDTEKDNAEAKKEYADANKRNIGRRRFVGANKGNLYHRVMELLDFQTPISKLKEQVQAMVEQKKIAEDAKYVSTKKIRNLLQTSVGQVLVNAQREGKLYKEQSFIMGIPAADLGLGASKERILIQGIIDAFAITEEGIILVDYKTDALDDVKAFLTRYGVQMRYYKQALEMSYQKKVVASYIYSFALEEWIAIDEMGDADDTKYLLTKTI